MFIVAENTGSVNIVLQYFVWRRITDSLGIIVKDLCMIKLFNLILKYPVVYLN